MHVCTKSLQSYPTLFSLVRLFATLWTLAHQTSLCTGFSRQGYWSRLPCPPPGDLPDPGIEPVSPVATAGEFFTAEPSGKPPTLLSIPKMPQPVPKSMQCCVFQLIVQDSPSPFDAFFLLLSPSGSRCLSLTASLDAWGTISFAIQFNCYLWLLGSSMDSPWFKQFWSLESLFLSVVHRTPQASLIWLHPSEEGSLDVFLQAQGSKTSHHHHHGGTTDEVAAPFFACVANGVHGMDAQAT